MVSSKLPSQTFSPLRRRSGRRGPCCDKPANLAARCRCVARAAENVRVVRVVSRERIPAGGGGRGCFSSVLSFCCALRKRLACCSSLHRRRACLLAMVSWINIVETSETNFLLSDGISLTPVLHDQQMTGRRGLKFRRLCKASKLYN